MIKFIELIIVLALLIFSFFTGVKYSDQVKERASWLFEAKEEEIELPEIKDQEGSADQQLDENGQVIDQKGILIEEDNQNINPGGVPMDSIGNEDDGTSAPVPANTAPTAPANKAPTAASPATTTPTPGNITNSTLRKNGAR